MKGIIPDYFRKIADYAGISYEFLTPATRDEYIAYQKNKEAADMSIDARLETDNYAETKKWGLTAPFITMHSIKFNCRCNGTRRRKADVQYPAGNDGSCP